jgi:hypothetical protein
MPTCVSSFQELKSEKAKATVQLGTPSKRKTTSGIEQAASALTAAMKGMSFDAVVEVGSEVQTVRNNIRDMQIDINVPLVITGAATIKSMLAPGQTIRNKIESFKATCPLHLQAT